MSTTVKRVSAYVALVLMATVLLVPAHAFAVEGETPTGPLSSRLVEEPKKYDGTEVAFTGEVIGEMMKRGDYAWLHLNDDAYMMKNVEEGATLGGYNTGMPVWLPADIAKRVAVFGDYKHEGDVVEVAGTFNAACAQHGGDMDIHATDLVVRFPGRRAADPVKTWKLPLAAVLALIVAGLWFAERRLGRHELVGGRKRRRVG